MAEKLTEADTENYMQENDLTEDSDVFKGSEPGASRNSVLIPTDSYEDIVVFVDRGNKTDGITSAVGSQDATPSGNIHMLKSQCVAPEADPGTPSDSDSERKLAVEEKKDTNLRVKPPDPIIARVDTPTSLVWTEDGSNDLSRVANRLLVAEQPDTAAPAVVCFFSLVWVLFLFRVICLKPATDYCELPRICNVPLIYSYASLLCWFRTTGTAC